MQTSITDKLDQLKACVHCGICLPACPTYLTTGNEGHSPRGRLYLIRDYVESTIRKPSHCEERSDEAIPLSPSIEIATVTSPPRDDSETINYLDACLGCRACETVCPSGVEYASILDYARHDAKLSNYNKGLLAFIRKISFKYLLANRQLLNLFRSFLALTNPIRVIASRIAAKQSPSRHCKEPQETKQSIWNKLQILLKLSPKLEEPYKPIQTNHIYQSKHPKTQTVSLPLGCVMDTLYNHVHWDTIKVLNAFGYNVYIPETNCCGALASHSGEQEIANKQTQTTLDELSKHQYPVVFNSAGCGAHLKNSVIASPHSGRSNPLAIYDFIELIQNAPVSLQDFSKQLTNQNPITATYHPACHLNHAQGIKTEYQELLKLIPKLKLIPLQEADVCCGSAGFYNLIKPQMANNIGARKASNIQKTQAEILVTANPGCISQIQAHTGNILVMHPISLIAKYLND